MAFHGRKVPKPATHNLDTFRDMLRKGPAYLTIINAVHQRGPLQMAALEMLDERRLWLTEEQKIQAGLASPVRRKA